MSKISPRHELLDRFAAVARVLAHGNRLDLLELMAQGEGDDEPLAVLHGCSPGEFMTVHAASAVNIPLKELRNRLGALPAGAEVVARCLLACEAVAPLRKRGRKVRKLEDGFPEWRVAGLPVEAAKR